MPSLEDTVSAPRKPTVGWFWWRMRTRIARRETESHLVTFTNYFGSFKEEGEFKLLMGKNFAMSGWNIEFRDGHEEPGVVCAYEG